MASRSIFESMFPPLTVLCLCFVSLTGWNARAQSVPTRIQIVPVRGEGSVSNPNQRSSTEPAVRVEDEHQNPLAGAAVVFTLPSDGASGEFVNNARSLTVTTDRDGTAVAKGLRLNDIPGKVPIHINASYRSLTAHITLTQFNVAQHGVKRGGHGKVVAALILIGGAAGAGVAVALNRNSATSAPAGSTSAAVPAIGLTPGTGTVGPPH